MVPSLPQLAHVNVDVRISVDESCAPKVDGGIFSSAAVLMISYEYVRRVGVSYQMALNECNELLKTLSFSWKDLQEVECRVDVKTMLGEICDSLSFDVSVPWPDTPMEISTTRYGGQLEDTYL